MRQFLILLIAVFLFASCKSSTAPEAPGSGGTTSDTVSIHKLFPLAYGDYWVHDLKQFDMRGDTVLQSSGTWEVIHTGLRNGQPSYIIEGFGNTSGSFQEGFYYSDSGLYDFNPSDTLHNTNAVYLQYPITFALPVILEDVSQPDGSHVLSEILFMGKDEKATVPAGTFSCYHYDYLTVTSSPGELDSTRTTSFLCPDVGLIRQTTWITNSGTKWMQSDMQLTAYRVN